MQRLRILEVCAVLVGLVVFLPAMGWAQRLAGHDRLDAAELGLTDEQKEQIRQIRERQREQLETLRRDQNLSPEERRAKARELRKQTREQVQAVLTPEQWEKLQQRRQQRREEMRKRGGRRGPGTRSGPTGPTE